MTDLTGILQKGGAFELGPGGEVEDRALLIECSLIISLILKLLIIVTSNDFDIFELDTLLVSSFN